jgi:hypothetical protein
MSTTPEDVPAAEAAEDVAQQIDVTQEILDTVERLSRRVDDLAEVTYSKPVLPQWTVMGEMEEGNTTGEDKKNEGAVVVYLWNGQEKHEFSRVAFERKNSNSPRKKLQTALAEEFAEAQAAADGVNKANTDANEALYDARRESTRAVDQAWHDAQEKQREVHRLASQGKVDMEVLRDATDAAIRATADVLSTIQIERSKVDDAEDGAATATQNALDEIKPDDELH